MKNLKKVILVFSVMIVSMLTFSACNSKYQIDVGEIPENVQEKLESDLAVHKENLKNATDEYDKADALAGIGFYYNQIGNYSKSISYYKQVLAIDPTHFPALNNMADMYEQVGELDQAIEYQNRLYEANPTDPGVVEDLIRMLVAQGRGADARGVLLALKKSLGEAAASQEWIKELERQLGEVAE